MSTSTNTIYQCADDNGSVWGFYQIEMHESLQGTMAAGNASLVCADAPFTSDMVGWGISVAGAGPAGAVLQTTIAAYTNSSHVTLTTAASTTSVGAVKVCFMPPRVDFYGFFNGAWPVMCLDNGDASYQGGLYFKSNDGLFTFLAALLPDTTSGDLKIFASKGGSNPAMILQSGKLQGQFYANDTNGIAGLVAAPSYDGQPLVSLASAGKGVTYGSLVNGSLPITSAQALTSGYVDVAGCSVSLPKGVYKVVALATFQVAGTGELLCEAALNVNGSLIGGTAQFENNAGAQASVSYEWYVTLTATETVKLQGRKGSAIGTGILTANTAMKYIQIG